jgi:hypothetical protein
MVRSFKRCLLRGEEKPKADSVGKKGEAFMKTIGAVPILIDSRKLRRIRIVCRCGTDWVESIPAEVHDSWLVMALFCPSCGAEFHLQNKQLERVEERSGTLPNSSSWRVPGSGGNA